MIHKVLITISDCVMDGYYFLPYTLLNFIKCGYTILITEDISEISN